MYLCIFEDESFKNFLPLSYIHPVFNFRIGAFRLGERIERIFPKFTSYYICRPYLKPVLRERGYKLLSLDSVPWKDDERVLFVNGAILEIYDLPHLVENLNAETIFTNNQRLLFAIVNGKLAKEIAYHLQDYDSNDLINSLSNKVKTQEKNMVVANFIWDLVTYNAKFIEQDFEKIFIDADRDYRLVDEHSIFYNKEKIFVGSNVRIDAMTVLDARQGPIILMPNAVVEPFSYIQGPVVIGENSRIVGGQIREGTSIGPVCRIGGEVEETIIQGFTNKYHAGFLGHSYIGEWVNLGAMTTNSDLKNTYSSIRVSLNQHLIDTNMQKLGIFVSDHVKIGIGTLINAGTTIGLGSNIFGGQVPKFVPNFVWGSDVIFSEYRIEKLVETIKYSMERRQTKFTLSEENLLRHVFYLTSQERFSL